jgi:cytochrome c biogenesis protein CcdA/thiol-disulfide isomerase/thioredoxin
VAILLGVAFLAGVITAISPCVLPVLPIILASSSTSESRWRPYAILGGLVVSFTTFTLAGAALLDALGLPADTLRDIAIAALLVLAATLVFPPVARWLQRPFAALGRRRPPADANGFVLGVSLGLVFVPCAGPVLAAISALAATGDVGSRTIAATAAYALGAALPMLAIAVGGRRLTSGVRVLRTHAETTRRAAGVVIGATALAIALGADQRFTTAIPGYTEALQDRIERSSVAEHELRLLSGTEDTGLASRIVRAPEFRGIEQWLNTPGGEPVSIWGLRGKVVILDFWTYSCINCLRTLPHLKAWDRAYRDEGLVIVGVHSPEFAFEREAGNVRSAVRRLGVRYPVALDNDFATWRAYDNQYWPAKYIVDRSGRVRYAHFGEGAYDETETWIRRLLGEKVRVDAERTSVADRTPHDAVTPEIYLGYARLDHLDGPVTFDREDTYTYPRRALMRDEVAYDGRWTVTPEHIAAGTGARMSLRFRANEIFLVLAGEGRVGVFVDRRRLPPIVVSGTPRLYDVARFGKLTSGLLELRFSPGVEGYAFTFG